MFRFFTNNKLKTKQKRDPKRYEKERAIAEKGEEKKRISLAQSSRTHQEILYYLAEKDPSVDVRKAVARNNSSPLHVSSLLAEDDSEEVRLALAGRLVELLPELTHEKHSQLYAYAVQALGTLALDNVLKIRKALSSALKDHALAPPKVALQLAKDIERDVSEPILRFCVALSDEDLMDIISTHKDGWQVEAIAARPEVSERVSHSIIETENIEAGKTLLRNEGAKLSRVLLEHIVDRARELPEWQEPVAMRKSLPPEMAKKLAEFVDNRVRTLLMERPDFSETLREEIVGIVARRMAFIETGETDETPMERAGRLESMGQLGEDVILDGMGMRDKEFVLAAIAVKARAPMEKIKQVMDMRAPKPICALCWKANLTMRTALKIQQEMGRVPPKELLYPKGGTDYPLTEEELNFQLEFLGLKAP